MTAFENVFVPLSGGVKSGRSDRMLGAKSAQLLAVGEGVIQLANCVVDRFWQVVKRSGSLALSNLQPGGQALPQPWRLATRGGQLVALSSYGATGGAAFTYSPSDQAWIPVQSTQIGPTVLQTTQRGPVSFKRTKVAAGPSFNGPTGDWLPGYYGVAYIDGTIGVTGVTGSAVFQLLDEKTGQVLFTDRQIQSGVPYTHVKVIACNGLFTMVATGNGTGPRATVYNPTSPASNTSHILGGGVTSSSSRANLDVIKISSTTIKVAYMTAAETAIRYIEFQPLTSAQTNGLLTDHSGGQLKADALCWVRDLAGTGVVSLVTVGGATGSFGAVGSHMLGGGAQLHYNIPAASGTPASTLAIDAGAVVGSAAPVMRVAAFSRSGTAQDVLTLIEMGATVPGVPTNDPVALATATFLPDTANNPDYLPGSTVGSEGIGATLTSVVHAALVVDGVTVTLGQRILVKDQTAGTGELSENGIYTVTQVGDATHPWILTRAIDCDEAGELGNDILVNVTAGSANAGKQFVHYGTPTIMETNALGSVPVDMPKGSAIFFSLFSSQPGNDRSSRFAIACSTVSGTVVENKWMLGLGISSAPFTMNGHTFILADYDNTPTGRQTQPLQSSYFLLELPASGAPLLTSPPVSQGNIAVGDGGGDGKNPVFIVVSNVAAVFTNSAGELVIPIQTRIGGTVNTDRAIELARVTNTAPVALGNLAEYAGSLVIPGAVVTMFDGSSMTALGFHIFPEPPLVSAGALSVTAQPVTYRWQLVYRWSDAAGRVHRSRPSAPTDVKAQAGSLSATVVAETYRLGDKTNVTIELYRSAANVPEVLYFVKSVANDPTVQTLTITDTAADSAISSAGPLLYTTGGVLSNDPLPGATEIRRHGTRLVFVSMDDPTQVSYSTPDDGGDGPGFPQSAVIQRLGPVTGLASFAEMLFFWEQGGVYFQSQSDGPDAQGRGLWPRAQPVVDGEGVQTTMPLSICVGPSGVYFRSSNPLDGISMVTRSLQVQPAGLDVQKYSDPPVGNIVAAAFVSAQSQTRFWTQQAATTLVHDETHSVGGEHLWSTFTGQATLSACIWNGAPVYYSLAAGTVVVETPGIWQDDGIPYSMDIISPWFSPLANARQGVTVPNLGGYFSLHDLLGIGTGQAGVTLVELRRDFKPDVLASWSGTPGPNWDWRVRGTWKLGCFQVRIVETSNTAGPTINGFTAGVAGKRGMLRQGSTRFLPPG